MKNLQILETENWYTIEELASLCGYSKGNALLANPNTNEILNQFNNSNDVRLGGYHNTQKFYSENVLKALKQYQISNSVPNATKDKVAAITGNVSFVANEARAQTVAAILADPTALLELVAQSSKKLIEKEQENKILKEKNELLMHTSKTYTASEIAKEAGLKSAVELNKILELKEIQYKRNGTWLPTSKYSGKGYYELKQTVLDNGMVVYDSRFTQSGREFILNLFKGA